MKGKNGEGACSPVGMCNLQTGRKKKQKKWGGKGSPIEFSEITQVSQFADCYTVQAEVCLYLHFIFETTGIPMKSYWHGTECRHGLQDFVGRNFARFCKLQLSLAKINVGSDWGERSIRGKSKFQIQHKNDGRPLFFISMQNYTRIHLTAMPPNVHLLDIDHMNLSSHFSKALKLVVIIMSYGNEF